MRRVAIATYWTLPLLTLLIILIAPVACAPAQEEKTPFKMTGKEVSAYVTLKETDLADGTHCVVVYSHGPSPGTAVSCDWHR